MSAEPSRVSEYDYLALERQSEIKHEYVRGELFAMAGARRAHNLICTNIVRHLGNQLAGHPCEIYQSDMRVQIASAAAYRYPDVVVVCGEPAFADTEADILLNPTVLVEVLSPSSIATDRGIKLWEYRQIASLQAYLLVTQDAPRIDQLVRQPDDTWLLSETSGVLQLPSIGCTLALSDVYARVWG
jgi:Uma2 family endonuclease